MSVPAVLYLCAQFLMFYWNMSCFVELVNYFVHILPVSDELSEL